ncbi:MAG: VWA domain-containing protein [Chloroflexi bacterium]|nr:VWA domain-containing protein [Chloroflexota bacterium]
MHPSGNLLSNCVLFGRLLRSLGMDIPPTQMVDVVDSLNHVHIGNRQDFKNMLAALLVRRREQQKRFEEAFDSFWQARWDSVPLKADSSPRSTQIEWLQPANSDGQESIETPTSPEIEIRQTYSDLEVLRQKHFAQLNEAELQALRQQMRSIVWQLEPRRTRRTERATRGALLDMRRTLRQNLRNSGDIFHLARRRRRYKRRPVVVLCDISGSMERYSRILLQFLYTVAWQLERVEVFVFSTRLTRITRQLHHRSIEVALADAGRAVHDWAGGTRIGDAIKQFNYQWARRVLNQGAVVLVVSDGWDRGEIDLLAREMARLQRSSSQVIWLNPLLGDVDYQPLVRGMQAALPYIDRFLPVHNLASLEQLASVLKKL